MAVHSVFISSKVHDGTAIDGALRARFPEVYRVGVEFWLVDTGRDADQVVAAMRDALHPSDKVFVAALKRGAVPVLSSAAHIWLTSPARTWSDRNDGRGEVGTDERPLAFAA